MNKDFEPIKEKTEKLISLCKKHQVYTDYHNQKAELDNDYAAKNLLSKIVILGQEIDKGMTSGDDSILKKTAEKDILLKELQKNSLVQKYIKTENSYLYMIQEIQAKLTK